MIITDKKKLVKYNTEYRLWQGIPSIEVTKTGKVFSAFYSGGVKEEIGNFVLLVRSDDGEKFSEPILVVFKENYRCFDPCLWIDPLDRLWLTWSVMPGHATYGIICEKPDEEELLWSEKFFIGYDVMMNKPTVLTTGEWFFPIAVWSEACKKALVEDKQKDKDTGAFVYKSIDNGKTFEKIGGIALRDRSFDEHMLLELKDGRIAMFIRTSRGIGVAFSFDRGKTWIEDEKSLIEGPCSRFFIGRLRSGRILLVYHNSENGARSHLTAMLSEDECKSWKYKLLLDERNSVSYPDVAEGDEYIYITYDRERGALLSSINEIYNCAREVLYAKISEQDIITGELAGKNSELKRVISKLGRYKNEQENPFKEIDKFTDEELTERLANEPSDVIIEKIFEYFSVNCENMHKVESEKLDELFEQLEKGEGDKRCIISDILTLVRDVSATETRNLPIVEMVKDIIMKNSEDDLATKEIAERAGISVYYLIHQFKKNTGTTITEYKNSLKITYAKKLLLTSDKSITEIAQECGFGSSSYFTKVFTRSEKTTPSEYRNLLKKN